MSLFFTLKAHRYPTINSGDTIALRSAHSSYSTSWFACHTTHCDWHSCQGTIITSSGWSSCIDNRIMFTITAMGKTDGEPIYSGDTVSLRSNYKSHGSSYRLYCTASSSTKCIANSYVQASPDHKLLAALKTRPISNISALTFFHASLDFTPWILMLSLLILNIIVGRCDVISCRSDITLVELDLNLKLKSFLTFSFIF